MLEHYGPEPPEPGWALASPGRWLKLPDGWQETLRNSDRAPRVAIIGGGPGGLFAAYILSHKLPSARVTIFEASKRLGGKILTGKFSDGTRFEAGIAELYEYKGPGGKDPLRQLIQEDLGLETVDMSGGAVVLGERLLRDLDEVEETYGQKTRRAIAAFHETMSELMPLDAYANRWQPDNAHPWAGWTFHQCLLDEIPDDPVARAYITAAVHSDLATEPHTCNGLNAIKNVLMDNPKYMQLYHVKGGIGRVASNLARRLEAEVRTRTRVTAVHGTGRGAFRVFYNHLFQDASEDFDCVLVALPNHFLPQIDWGKQGLAEAIHEVCAHYDLPAHYLRVSMLFREPWWEKLDIPGDYWMMDCFNGCCCYNERARWRTGNVLSFLLGGGDALMMCSANQGDLAIVEQVLTALPAFMRSLALQHLESGRVDRYAGSINAQPGGWPAEELRGEHVPEPERHPGVFLVGDYFFDSTLNGVLMSANTAVDLLLEHLGMEAKKMTPAIRQLTPDGPTLSIR